MSDRSHGVTVGSSDDGHGSRTQALLERLAKDYRVARRALGILEIYRLAGGGLIVSGLAYAALFALIPAFAMVVAVIYIITDDPQVQREAIDLINRALPAFEDVLEPVVDQATRLAGFGVVAVVLAFGWGASSLYLNLQRAMERFFPGKRRSGAIARVIGVLLVLLVTFGVLAALFVSGVLTVVARILGVDSEWLISIVGVMVVLVLSTILVYGVYRVMPSEPPAPQSARLPAALVGVFVSAMTLLYGQISPWLVSGWQEFGVMASVFVALIWLRAFFLAVVFGAATARYRDLVGAAADRGDEKPDAAATTQLMAQDATRADDEKDAMRTTGREE